MIVIAVFLAAYLIVTSISPMSSVTKEQAENLVVGDLMSKYPGAEINITNATSSIYPGSSGDNRRHNRELNVSMPVLFRRHVRVSEVRVRQQDPEHLHRRLQDTGLLAGPAPLQLSGRDNTRINVSGVKDYLGAFGFGNVTVLSVRLRSAKRQPRLQAQPRPARRRQPRLQPPRQRQRRLPA